LWRQVSGGAEPFGAARDGSAGGREGADDERKAGHFPEPVAAITGREGRAPAEGKDTARGVFARGRG